MFYIKHQHVFYLPGFSLVVAAREKPVFVSGPFIQPSMRQPSDKQHHCYSYRASSPALLTFIPVPLGAPFSAAL